MRMKKIFLLLIITLISTKMYGQGLNNAQDFIAGEFMISAHRTQHNAFGRWRTNEGVTLIGFNEARNTMQRIEELNTRINSRLSNWQAIVGDVNILINMRGIVGDIGRLQGEMVQLAWGDPALITVAWETERLLLKRTEHLMGTVYNAVINPINLMDDAQRRTLLRHIDMELRTMRGMAFSVVRQMRTAQRNGINNNIFVGFDCNRARIAHDILTNYRFVID
jgi:hypothetical protein